MEALPLCRGLLAPPKKYLKNALWLAHNLRVHSIMASLNLSHIPVAGIVALVGMLAWALSLSVRVTALWRWSKELERWRTVQRRRREEARRQLGLT